MNTQQKEYKEFAQEIDKHFSVTELRLVCRYCGSSFERMDNSVAHLAKEHPDKIK
jgi:hypothetical protein